MALLATAGTVDLLKRNADYEVSIEADMLVSRGTTVSLYVNDPNNILQQLAVVTGVRHIYRFEHIPHEITLLRLDPTDIADARIVIYSVTIKTGPQTFQRFGAEELTSWVRSNASTAQIQERGLALLATNHEPAISTSLSLRLPGGTLQPLSELIGGEDGPFLLAITGFLLLLLLRMTTRTGRLQAVLIAVIAGMAMVVVVLVRTIDLPPPPVTTAVGYANYNGYSKTDDYLAAFTLMLLCAFVGYAFAGVKGGEEEEGEETAPASSRRNAWITTAAVFAMVFMCYLPNLWGSLRESSQMLYQSHGGLDDANALTWSYMINAGLRPFRDFWYPYSGSYLQLLPFPVGVLASVVHSTIVLGVLFLALLKATGRRIAHALVIFGLILTPVRLDTLPRWTRTVLAIDVALLSLAVCEDSICNSGGLEWKKHAPFAVFVGYVFLRTHPACVCRGRN